jgi:preprotein translocase subunit YajC
MKLEEAKQTRIIKNAFLSLLLYVLPIVLMFATFYITGQRPWEKQETQHKWHSVTKNKNVNTQPQSND